MHHFCIPTHYPAGNSSDHNKWSLLAECLPINAHYSSFRFSQAIGRQIHHGVHAISATRIPCWPHNVKCAVSQDHWAPPYSSHSVGISSWTVGSVGWAVWLPIGHISHSHFSECNLHPLIPADIADIVQACSEDLRSVISRFLIKARFQEAFAETVPSDLWDLPWNCDGQDAKERLDLAEAGAVSVRWGGNENRWNPILQVGLNSRCNESACGLCSLSWVPFRVSTSARASFHRLLGLVG